MDKISLLKVRNQAQKDYQQSLHNNIVTLALGPAGTGKTLLAINYAVAGLSNKLYEKIIYIRPDVAVENQRGRGALPGELKDKSLPLLAPVLDNLKIFCQDGLKNYLLEKSCIEYVYLEDVRGRSFNNVFVILDEAQNTTVEQFKTVLTRIGSGSTLAIMGDTSQVDVSQLRLNNGLLDASLRLKGLKDVGIIQFTIDDIVRSPLLKDILRRYSSNSISSATPQDVHIENVDSMRNYIMQTV